MMIRNDHLQPVIPALIGEAGARGSRARYDFWLTVGELVSERFFGQIREWCDEHGILSGGHLLQEDNGMFLSLNGLFEISQGCMGGCQ